MKQIFEKWPEEKAESEREREQFGVCFTGWDGKGWEALELAELGVVEKAVRVR